VWSVVLFCTAFRLCVGSYECVGRDAGVVCAVGCVCRQLLFCSPLVPWFALPVLRCCLTHFLFVLFVPCLVFVSPALLMPASCWRKTLR